MKLIYGGAYMGKRTWAMEHWGLAAEDMADLEKGLPQKPKRCLCHLEALTWEAARAESTPEAVLAALEPYLNENTVVIAREVGSGVVPMDKTERLWRELHGAVVKTLAKGADSVVRVFCGLGEVLK